MKTLHLLLLAALAMTAVSSCSDSEPVAPPDINPDMKEIRFSADMELMAAGLSAEKIPQK